MCVNIPASRVAGRRIADRSAWLDARLEGLGLAGPPPRPPRAPTVYFVNSGGIRFALPVRGRCRLVDQRPHQGLAVGFATDLEAALDAQPGCRCTPARCRPGCGRPRRAAPRYAPGCATPHAAVERRQSSAGCRARQCAQAQSSMPRDVDHVVHVSVAVRSRVVGHASWMKATAGQDMVTPYFSKRSSARPCPQRPGASS